MAIYEFGDNGKNLDIIVTYLNEHNLLLNIDYYFTYNDFYKYNNKFSQAYRKYEFIDKTHETILKLLLL